MFSRIPERASSAVGHFGAWCIFALMVTGVVGIITRFSGAPLSGIISLSIFIFISSVYLLFAYAQVRDSHVAVHFVLSRLPSKHRLVMESVTTFLSSVACFFLVWASWLYAWESLMIGERMHGEPYYPVYPAKLCVAIGATIFFLQLVADFGKALQSLREKSVSSDQSKGDKE